MRDFAFPEVPADEVWLERSAFTICGRPSPVSRTPCQSGPLLETGKEISSVVHHERGAVQARDDDVFSHRAFRIRRQLSSMLCTANERRYKKVSAYPNSLARGMTATPAPPPPDCR